MQHFFPSNYLSILLADVSVYQLNSIKQFIKDWEDFMD